MLRLWVFTPSVATYYFCFAVTFLGFTGKWIQLGSIFALAANMPF